MSQKQQQGSFIPQSPVGSRPTRQPRLPQGGTNKLNVITSLLFIIVLIAYAGVYFYEGYLQNTITEKKALLAEKEREILSADTDLLIHTDRKIEEAKKVLNNHISVANFFEVIEEYTVKTVSFDTLDLTGTPGSSYTLEINGAGTNIASLVIQSDVLRLDPALRANITNSSLVSTEDFPESGASLGLRENRFDITATVNPAVLSFQKTLAQQDDSDIGIVENINVSETEVNSTEDNSDTSDEVEEVDGIDIP